MKDRKRTRHGKLPTQLGKMITLWRAVHQLSFRDLAPQIGISSATLLRIEQGYEVDTATFFKLLEWLRKRPALAKGGTVNG